MSSEAKMIRDRERNDLTTGSITKKLVFFSLPIIVGNLAQQLYNVVDSIVVGNFAANGTECLAAVNASFPVMMVFNALYMGISMGSNIIIAQYKGAKDHERLEDTMTTTFVLSMLAGLVITVLGLIFARPILEALNTPDNIIEDAAVYLRIVFIGTCGNVVYNGFNGMLRGLGDAKWPLYALLVSSGLNIVLDIVFVMFFHWDVAGVAWATIIAHFISGLLLVWRQTSGVYGAKVNFRKLRVNGEIAKLIVRLGTPAAVQNLAFSGGMLINQSFSNRFSSDFIAANAIMMKVDGFAIMPMMGFNNAITTYVGQNIGAGNMKRVNRGIRTTLIISICCTLVVSVLMVLFGKYIMMAFGVTEKVLLMGVRGLSFVAFFYVFMAIQSVLTGALRGAGDAITSAVTSVVGTLVRVPLGWLLSIMPLNRDCQAAVDAGLYATRQLAEKAGVGMEHYFGLFQTWGFGMVVGVLLIVPCYLFGHWRDKAITSGGRLSEKAAQ
ncbi:MAG: MATE family efflux transporter [Oscillospiraceae bacterium]|nr:MATE family efflux transporter [Oscillospiraceae bacterium]